jgi:hypothetical protein
LRLELQDFHSKVHFKIVLVWISVLTLQLLLVLYLKGVRLRGFSQRRNFPPANLHQTGDVTVFAKNRERLLVGEVAQRLCHAVSSKQLLADCSPTSTLRYGTLIEGWAVQKRKEDDPQTVTGQPSFVESPESVLSSSQPRSTT